MDDWVSMVLTVAAEVKSEFVLERFGEFPEDCDFMGKYGEFITVY